MVRSRQRRTSAPESAEPVYRFGYGAQHSWSRTLSDLIAKSEKMIVQICSDTSDGWRPIKLTIIERAHLRRIVKQCAEAIQSQWKTHLPGQPIEQKGTSARLDKGPARLDVEKSEHALANMDDRQSIPRIEREILYHFVHQVWGVDPNRFWDLTSAAFPHPLLSKLICRQRRQEHWPFLD